jgi:hypothetical protein
MTETKRWPAFGYVQVPGLANRLIARWLRTQRKNMRRFFVERGLIDLADRMDRIRNSNTGMMEKNRKFQAVLDSYAAQTMQAQTTVSKQTGQVRDVCSAEGAGVETSQPGPGYIQVNGVASEEPGEDKGNILQVSEVSDTDPVIDEGL